jgi:hypothetical protein
MRREDLLELIQKLPPSDLSKIMLVLHNGIGIIVDTLFKTEPEFLVIRGREAGTTDENRAFFLPYGEVAYLKLERSVKLTELQRMYGMPIDAALADTPEGGSDTDTPGPVGEDGAAQSPAVDPAVIARQNLLDRIRAARTSAGAPRRGK